MTSAQPGPGAYTVLCVDDSPPNLKLVERILARLPAVHLLSAERGQTALELARAHHPRLVLLDLHLPDISGEEVLLRLRADAATADVAVVILSADAAADRIARLRDMGAAGYLTKPLDVAQLLAVVDGYAAPKHGEDHASPGGGAASAADSVLDGAMVAALHDLGGDAKRAGSVARVVDMFLTEGRGRITELGTSGQRSDFSRVEQVAHGLAGTSANLGAHVVASLARDLESAARHHDVSAVLNLTARVAIAFDMAEAALRAEFLEGDSAS